MYKIIQNSNTNHPYRGKRTSGMRFITNRALYLNRLKNKLRRTDCFDMESMKTLKRKIICGVSLLSALAGSAQTESPLFREFKADPSRSLLQDFSYAGYGYGAKNIPTTENRIDVTEYGILPNLGDDLTERVQHLLDSIGQAGGGVVFFPKGRYCFNMDSTRVQFLKIDYDHLVIRGEGSSEEGTVFFCGNPNLQEHTHPWLSPFLIRFGYALQKTDQFWGVAPKKQEAIFQKSNSASDPGSDGSICEADVLTTVTQDAPRGSRRLRLKTTQDVGAGDVVILALYNMSDDAPLLRELLGYKAEEITEDLGSARSAGVQQVASFQYLLEIEEVISSHEVLLKQPLRREVTLRDEPVIARAHLIRHAGIEHLRLESAWDGVYLHHGGGKYPPRASKIMDYGWNAVNFCRVAHGWMKNVVISNFTNPVYLQDARNVTVTDVTIEGHDGHCGIKIYAHAADNLISDIRFNAHFTHVLSGEGPAYGNVFRKIAYHAQHRKEGCFDFHGFASPTYSPPAWNLFEQVDGLSRIDGGGAPYNFPHTARGNVWWNCSSSRATDNPGELFAHWVWRKDDRSDHHKMYPGSVIAGFRSAGNAFLINDSAADRNEELIYVENLNQGAVYPSSLYEEQLRLRLKEASAE